MDSYMRKCSNQGEYVSMGEGIRRKTLVYGDNTVMCRFEFDKGVMVPLHSHIYEQTGYLLQGKVLFTIDGMRHEMNTGDSWCIKGNVEHSAEMLEETILIEIFSPLRYDYI